MKRVFCFTLSICWACSIFAQSAIFSNQEAVDYSLSHFEILGKHGNTLVILKYGQNNLNFRFYDEELEFIKEETFTAGGKRVQIIGYYDTKNTIRVFVHSKKGGEIVIEEFLIDSQQVNSLKFVHQLKSRNFEGKNFELIYSRSKENAHILIVDDYSGKPLSIEVIDTRSNENQIHIWNDKQLSLAAAVLNNSGLEYYLLKHKPIGKRAEHSYSVYKGKELIQSLGSEDTTLNELTLEIDEENQNLVLVGLYSKKNAKSNEGVFYQTIGFDDHDVITNQYLPFSSNLAKEITGKEQRSGRPFTLKNLKIRDVVLKQKGGVVLNLEKAAIMQSGVAYPITENNTLYDAIWQPETKTQVSIRSGHHFKFRQPRRTCLGTIYTQKSK